MIAKRTLWIVTLLAASPALSAQEPSKPKEKPASRPAGILPIEDYKGDIWERKYILGDLDGMRTQLAEEGFSFGADFTQILQSVTGGGRDKETRYGGSMYYWANVDFDRMGLIPGGLLEFVAETRYGESVNTEAGPILPVNLDGYIPITKKQDEDIPFAITQLSYTQFVAPELGFFLGKLITFSADENEFASGMGKTQFLNYNLNYNSIYAMLAPYSTLGAGVIVIPCKNALITSSITNTDDSSTTTGFQDFGDGYTWDTEVSAQTKLGDLPGGALVGFIYDFNNDFVDFSKKFIFVPGTGIVAPTKSETYGVYANAWQYLLALDDAIKPISISNGVQDLRGVGLFARGGLADNDVNPAEWYVSAGASAKGVIPERDYDTMGLGYYYTDVSVGRIASAIGVGNHSQGIEGYYNFAITPAAQLTADIQWNQTPLPGVNDSVTIALRLYLKF